MKQKNLDKLIEEALAIEARDAKESGALGFMARAMVQATLPHRKVVGNEFKRKNGLFKLTILADSEVGLPYGSIPRLLLAWISTEAVRNRDRNLVLGNSLSEFMSDLDLVPTGGRWGSITRLKTQMKCLFSSAVSCTYDNGEHWAIKNIQPVRQANLWWNPQQPDQAALFESTLILDQGFYDEVLNNPIPINMDTLKALKRSPLALDIYCWLTYRMSYLSTKTEIPWTALQAQFGSNYSVSEQGTRDFKRAFLRELKKVYLFYSSSLNKVEQGSYGLILKPSIPHIKS